MESDGRIRSKDIGTNQINSRALDNIRSSNYDGSHTDPETNPGTQGWQILKNGFVVINNAIIRGTLLAGKIISGTLNIGSGGSITVGDEADPLVTLDESGLTVGDAPVVIDATGVQVGTDVVIDSTGLKIEGVLQPAFWPFGSRTTTSNVSLTTTPQDVLTITVNPPDWVESLHVTALHRLQISNTSAGTQNIRAGVTIDNGGASEDQTTGTQGTNSASLQTAATVVPNAIDVPLSPAGRSVDVVAEAWVQSGTNSSNFSALTVFGYGTRV